ncbi:hypothetical protein F5Y04DRAFT_70713 [Hypomontagnella monticulosa]|nr:hypothetical protein F5Y04DRAFT_70713 [Hypomontagnella monticulosa]
MRRGLSANVSVVLNVRSSLGCLGCLLKSPRRKTDGEWRMEDGGMDGWKQTAIETADNLEPICMHGMAVASDQQTT